jgi:hypothetical protein
MAIDDMTLTKATTFLGRNGYFMMKGIEVADLRWNQVDVVELRPITTKGYVARAFMQIPVEDVEEFITVLQKFIHDEPEPNKCPQCGSGDIEGGSVEIDGRHAIQRVRCSECGATWVDEYALESQAVAP